MCYEGAVDLDTVKDANARHALEIQISEFGQIPKQLFTRPHVSRDTESSLQIESPKRRSLGTCKFKISLCLLTGEPLKVRIPHLDWY